MNRDLYTLIAVFGWFMFRSIWIGGVVVVAFSIIVGDLYMVLPGSLTLRFGVRHGESILIGLASVPYFLLLIRLLVRRPWGKT